MSGADQSHLPEVWNLQERVSHYRTPVWDRLVERSEGVYRFLVVGHSENGAPFGGAKRPYIRHQPLSIRRIAGQPVNTWPRLRALVRSEKPAVVFVNPNPRTIDCWTLPRMVRRQGGAIIGWSKVTSNSGLPPALLERAKKRLFRAYDLIAVYGEQARDELISLGYPEGRIVVAQNTIDTDFIFTQEDDVRAEGRRLLVEHGLEGRRVLLYVGRMVAKKRVHDLIEAWPRLRALDSNLDLVIVGDGSQLEEIRTRARTIDPDRIHVTGRVAEGADYAWIAAADCAIQCGAIGLAINQSMALGIPTVVADEPGSDSELVRHGDTGWRYRKGDLDALTEAVGSVIRDPENAARVAERGRNLMRDVVTLDGMVDALDNVIRRGLDIARERGASL